MSIFDRLNPRERLFVMGGGLLVIVLVIFTIIRFIVVRRIEISDAVSQERENFNRIQRLAADIKQLPAARDIPDVNRLKSLIFTRMEKHGLKADIRDRVENISRTEEKLVVDLNFKGMSLKALIDFLHDIEYGRGVSVQVGRFQINRPLPGKEIYDGIISLYTIRPRNNK